MIGFSFVWVGGSDPLIFLFEKCDRCIFILGGLAGAWNYDLLVVITPKGDNSEMSYDGTVGYRQSIPFTSLVIEGKLKPSRF